MRETTRNTIITIFLIGALSFSTQNAHANRITDVGSAIGKKVKSWIGKSSDEAADGAENSRAARRQAPETVGRMTERISLEEVISPVVGRGSASGFDLRAQDVASVFRRKKKAAPINIAPAGAGKSEFIRYFQYLIDQQSDLVRNLHGKNVYELNVNRLTGGTELQGSLQQRFDEILTEVADPKNSNKILVIDELEEVLKDEKHGKAFIESLKSYMAGDMNGAKLMFNITPPAYENLMTDAQLIRRMVSLTHEPPSDDVVRNILKTLSEEETISRGVEFSEEQLEKIFRLSKQHPSLSNPDVAITLLDDAVNRAITDLETGSRVITKTKEKITEIDGKLSNIRLSREQGVLKFFGPYFKAKEKRFEDMKTRLSGMVRSYEDSRRQTQVLREELLEKIQKRKELQELETTRRANHDYGNVEVDDSIEDLNEEIRSLSQQIREENPLLNGVEVKDEHIISAAEVNLPRSRTQIIDEMNGGASSQVYTERAVQKNQKFLARKEVLQSVVERVLLKRRILKEQGELPTFIIVDPSGNESKDLVEALSKELYEVSPYRISGSEVAERTSLNKDIGAPDGYGSGNTGALYKAGMDSNGYMTLFVDRFDRGAQALVNFVDELITSRVVRSNRGETVDFNDTSVFMTASDEGLKMSDEQLSQFNELTSDQERQAFLRAFLGENFSGRISQETPSGYKLETSFLEKTHIVYLDSEVKADVDMELFNRLKDDSFVRKIEEFEADIEFSESVVAHLADIARQLAGDSNFDSLLNDEILLFLQRSRESGRLVPGDQALIHYENGSYLLYRVRWEDGTRRKALLDEMRAGFNQTLERARGNRLDAEGAEEALEGLLDEASRLR